MTRKRSICVLIGDISHDYTNELMRGMNLRYTPELQFYEDNNIAYGVRINELLKKVNAGEGQERDQTEE